MCRIVGGFNFNSNNLLTEEIVLSMRDELSHGGPDSGGIFSEESVFLAHRRLAIIDLSDLGKQPMIFQKWIISFNGEIYNFKEIRYLLEQKGVLFNTDGDTEVIVKSYEIWGSDCVSLFRGMFAFALWNREEKVLTLCRDRFGVKPLFYYYKDGLFLFSSELKAFHRHPNFDKSINLRTIPHYLSKGYIKDTECIYNFVNKVQPGCLIHINQKGVLREEKYWDLTKKIENSTISVASENELLEQLEEILIKSFSLRMVSDVPVGVFLSGGIDSSLVTALLQKESGHPLNTFNISFEDKLFNEGIISKQISQILGTKHTSIECNEQDFLNVIPKLSYIYDEPFGDSSAIPTYLVSKYARESVKVALSGDGGDELFGGYAKYKFVNEFSKYLSIPNTFRNRLMELSYLIKPSFFEEVISSIGYKSYTQFGAKFYKLRQTLGSNNINELFDSASSYLSKNELNLISNYPIEKIIYCELFGNRDKWLSNFGYWDMISFLPGDVLTKVDRASMHVALETREPFLDPEILDFAFSLPSNLKISKNGKTKYLLKKLLSKYLPNEIIDRPKYGFSIPISDWMHKNLKSEILVMLQEKKFFDKFLLNQNEITKICNKFFSNDSNINPHSIWFIYCLYKWYIRWV